MAEPVTTTLALVGLGWVAGGIVGNASDRVFCDVLRSVKGRVAGLRGLPENHDVAKAVRTAQMQALEGLIQDYRKIGRPEWITEPHTKPEIFFERSLQFCRETVGRCLDPRIKLNLDITESLTVAIDGILTPPVHDGPAGVRSRKLDAFAEQAVLDELLSVLGSVRLPDGFETHFREGASDRPRFLDLFGTCIAEQLKENKSFRVVFTTGQLARIEELAFDAHESLARIETTHGAMLKEILARVSTEKNVPAEPLRAILARLGEANVPDDQISARLEAKGDEFLALREQWSKVQNQHPNVVTVRQYALQKMDAGDLDAARALLAKAREHIRELRQERSREEAALLADEAAIDQLELRYRKAADKFAEAAQLVEFDGEAILNYRNKEAEALYHQGDEFGDNDALVKLIGVLEPLEERFGQQMPPKWGQETHRHLNMVRHMLGERTGDRLLLQEAQEGFRLLRENPIADREPLQQVVILICLNSVRLTLAKLEGGSTQLNKTLRVALDELQPNRVAHLGAGGRIMAFNHLGTVAAECGERDCGPTGTALLKKAVQAFRSALDLRGIGLLEGVAQAFPSALDQKILKQAPRNWATIQMHLGNARSSLGARDEGPQGTALLEDAVKTFQAALKEQTRKRLPLDWATTKFNLGNALMRLGEREEGTARLKEAVEAYEEALKDLKRERVPLDWAATQNNLGNAFRILGEREDGTAGLEKAVAACRAALEERTRERVRLDWAMTQNILGLALAELGVRTQDRATLEEAREAVGGAFAVHMQDGQEHRRPYFEDRLRAINEVLAQIAEAPPL